jgi:hypothetical protein
LFYKTITRQHYARQDKDNNTIRQDKAFVLAKQDKTITQQDKGNDQRQDKTSHDKTITRQDNHATRQSLDKTITRQVKG